jgi:hypothetical protein
MLNEPALSGFTGNYRSDELDATYKVSLVKGARSLQIGTEAPVKMNPPRQMSSKPEIAEQSFSRILVIITSPV